MKRRVVSSCSKKEVGGFGHAAFEDVKGKIGCQLSLESGQHCVTRSTSADHKCTCKCY